MNIQRDRVMRAQIRSKLRYSPTAQNFPPVLLAATLSAWLGLVSTAGAACKGEDGGSAMVTALSDGETLILDDGRAVRLMDVIGPKRARGGPASDARAQMETELSGLVLGKKILLQLDKRQRDRYGRLVAQIMVETGAEPLWLQGKLVEDGLARVISLPDNRLCIAELLAKEDDARRAQTGLWKSGFFAVRPAEAEDLLFKLAQSYEIVEGEVRNVTELKGAYYINFGQNWRRDFTAYVSAKSAALFSGAEKSEGQHPIDIAQLKGRHIRVRGWLKNFNGPSMTVTHPEQIEILDGGKSASR
jgi:endonuclease YncB( thermonuclease family)